MDITQRMLMANPGVGSLARKIGQFISAIVLLAFPGAGLFAMSLEAYPGAEVVHSSVDKEIKSRRIILGALKKINNVLEPKFYQYVSGTESSTTYYIPVERRVSKVVEFYRDQVDKSANVLFSCEGRDCGSSNYWANTVFKTPLLYGPEQYQRYMIARDPATNTYIAIYVGQRGTKKIYVHVLITNAVEKQSTFVKGSLADSLQTRGKFVIPTEDFLLENSEITDIVDFMAVNPQSTLTLVAHDSLQSNESIEESLQRTLRLSNSVRSNIVARGISKERIQTFGIGPLSPLDAGHSSRLELLVID